MAYTEATKQTTLAAIKAYPMAQGYNDEAISQAIADTWSIVLSDELPDTVSERGHRLLVLHNMVVDSTAQSGGVSRASTKDYTQEMFDWSQGNDPYMVEYERLVAKFGKGRWGIAFL
ncbi:DUF4054 domain-containing protein [Levilactobacillus senmaizukei]|nr:DUF4054 domain-containing protein [Levilactobacillus senmaizukei]